MSCLSLVPSLGTVKILYAALAINVVPEATHDHSPEGIPRDSNQAIWAHFRREGRCILQRIIDERCEFQAILISVVQPGSTGQCQDSGSAMNVRPNEFGRLGTEEPVGGINVSSREVLPPQGTCLVRVSVNSPLTVSTTVRSSTPVWRPILRNIVGLFLSIVVSNISARQMEDGGAVRA